MVKHRNIIPTVSKVYSEVNVENPSSYWEYDHFPITWNKPSGYNIVKRVGRGKYSEVFEGRKSPSEDLVIIKVLKPVRFKKIRREIKVLENLDGGDNIIKLLDCVKEPESKTLSFIFEHVNGVDMYNASSKFDLGDIRHYIYQLLKALNYCHAHGIIHRDVKPRNIMIDPTRKRLRLIDWGLADFYFPNLAFNVSVSTRNYKGPELLLNYKYYDYSLDLWAVGCTLASLMFKRHPFFRAMDKSQQLRKVAQVLGSSGLKEYVEKYNIPRTSDVESQIGKEYTKKDWFSFINDTNRTLVDSDGLDLLEHLLVYDHQERFTAEEAMQHRFFDSVREGRK